MKIALDKTFQEKYHIFGTVCMCHFSVRIPFFSLQTILIYSLMSFITYSHTDCKIGRNPKVGKTQSLLEVYVTGHYGPSDVFVLPSRCAMACCMV